MEKLCNSLHIRLLMRISNKVNVSTKTEIITKPAAYPLFQSNADNANYVYSEVTHISPMSDGVNRLYAIMIVLLHI
jgi:hypothetical protein